MDSSNLEAEYNSNNVQQEQMIVRVTFKSLMTDNNHLAVLLRWGTETSDGVPTSSSYRRPPLIDRQYCHFHATGG